MSRVPRIRFKGFEEDWEQRKLGEVANRFDSTRIPISENLRVSGKTPYYGANGIQDYVDGYTHDGEYVLIAEDGANDLKNYPIRLVKGRIWVNNHAHVIQGMEKFMNNQFINFAMSQVDFESIVVGCGRAKLNAEQLMDICFKIPNKNEQANIGRLFESINHLITLHQRKLEKLKIIKKSMLENLFPQNGEKTPKIRFSGFTKDWEQRKHGEVFIYLRNNTLSREELNDEDGFAQSIHYGDVLIKYGECLNVSKELLPYIDNKNIVNKFKKFYIQNGDVIIADTAEDETVGKCIEISGIVDHNIISGLHTIPLRPVNKFAYGYLGFYLNSNSYHNQLKPLMQGIKVTSISKNLLKTTTLNYPSNIQEQKIIGRYFDALNHLITLHQSKLEKLQKIKKSMLESMFV